MTFGLGVVVLGTADAALAATQTYNGTPVQIIVNDLGAPTLNAKPSTRQQPADPYIAQYCCGTTNPQGWGSALWLQNSAGTWSSAGSGYLVGGFTAVSNTTVVSGTSTEIVTVVNAGSSGVRVTQRIRHVAGDRFVTKEWSIENTGSTSYQAARFYHGGDTMFGGDDSASGFYDASKSMVYIRNNAFADWGIMGFYANPATPADRYAEGNYSTIRSYAANRTNLPNTVVSSYHDAGYMLEWNRTALNAGSSWSIQAFEVWTPGGAIQLLPPGSQNAAPASSVTLPFTVQNLGNTPLTLNLSAASAAGWPTSLVDATAVTIPANSSVVRNVKVDVPAAASGSSAVTLTASGGATGSATTTLSVVNVALGTNPSSITFGSLAPGGSGSVTVTVTNNGTDSLTLGTLSALSPFGKASDTCSGALLVAAQSCTVNATFTSSTNGTYNGALNIPVLSPILLTRTVALGGVISSGHPVTAVAGANGSLSASTPSPVTVNAGSTTSFTFNASPGYRLASISGCGGTAYTNSDNAVTVQSYTTGTISGACTVNASFAIQQWPVTFSTDGTAGASLGGSVSQLVNHGGSSTPVTAVAPTTHRFGGWTGAVSTQDNPLTVSNVTGSRTVTATFVAKTVTTVAVSSSQNPILVGDAVTFRALVSPAAATGTFTFVVDGQAVGAAVPLVDGQASVSVPGLSVGPHTVAAQYSGDARYLSAQGTLSGGQSVARHPSAVAVQSVPFPSVVGQPVSLVAQVSAAGGGAPGGTVIFVVDGAPSAPVAVAGDGSATFPVSDLSVGSHSVVASYAGDATHDGAVSETAVHVVERAPVEVTITQAPSARLFGEPVSLQAQVAAVAPGAGVPGGQAEVLDGATVVASGVLVAGVLSVDLTSLTVGSHALRVRSLGSPSYQPGVSLPVFVDIARACVVAAQVFADGVINPSNPCQVCDARAAVGAWSNVAAETACPSDGLSCTADQCNGAGVCAHNVTVGCVVGGACVAEGTVNPANECAHCAFAADPRAYSPRASRVACSDDGSALTDDWCDGRGMCIHPPKNECLIDGVVVPGGARNPQNSCQACDVLANDRGWTNRAGGSSCASDSRSCTLDLCDDSGVCQHTLFVGCLIGGACLPDRSVDPQNDCAECNPAVATDAYSPRPRGVECADDGASNTLDACDGAGACAHTLRGLCTIEGQSYAAGAANPANRCQVCQPSLSAGAWSARVEGFPCAEDALSCTQDICNGEGACVHPLYTGCLLDGACVPEGTANPANACLGCFPGASTVAWTPRPAGVACADDGQANTSDVCNALGSCTHPLRGECLIDGVTYRAGVANPENPCQACAPAESVSTWSNREENIPCGGDGLDCTADVCDGAGVCAHRLAQGCMMDGACVAERALDPQNDCRECNPLLSTSEWSVRPRGLECADEGQANTLDTCDGAGTCVHTLRGQCVINSVTYAAGASNPANRCQACEPSVSSLGWSARVEGFPCPADALSCTQDVCDGAGACTHPLAVGCMVDGACVPDGAVSPANACLGCFPSVSTSSYTSRAAGVACLDDGEENTADVCNAEGVCTHPLRGECVLDGVTYRAGAVNPDNPCQACAPAQSVSQWSPREENIPCGSDGLSCTADVCDGTGVCAHRLSVGCLMDGACVAENALDPQNDCRACNPALSTSDWSARPRGLECADEGLANTLDFCDGLSNCVHTVRGQCVIGGVTYAAGAANPDNACESCDPYQTSQAWSARVEGFPCPEDALSCTRDICNGTGECVHPLYVGCLMDGACIREGAPSPQNVCLGCFPSVASDAYTPRAMGVACVDDGEENTADICNGAGGCVHPLLGECIIGGQTFRAGTANPDNPCQACQPALSAGAWTNRVQNFPCTSDDLSCTTDVCDGSGTCEHRLADGCLLEGACVAAGVVSPEDDCLGCFPAVSTSRWTARSAGVACADDGQPTTADICDGAGGCTHPQLGECVIDGVRYRTGAANPQNDCQSCEPASNVSTWSNRVSGFPCGADDLSCTRDVCSGAGVCEHPLYVGCMIGGACVAAGSLDPQNECLVCNPTQSSAGYSPQPRGVACADDGESNTLDACSASGECTHVLAGRCTVDGVSYNAGAQNPQNACQSCDPAASATAFTDRVAGFPCPGDALSCTADICNGAGACEHPLVTGCLLGGACVPETAVDPQNECGACQPVQSSSAYTPRPRGVVCGDDGNAATLDVCDGAGACAHVQGDQCSIGGQLFNAGAVNPDNACEQCSPVESRSRWSARDVGTVCPDDGLSCTTDACGPGGVCNHQRFEGCLVGGACVQTGVTDPQNDCLACDPAVSATTFSVRARGVVCTEDGDAQTADRCDGAGVCMHVPGGSCSIDGVTYAEGTAHPDNGCMACDPSASTVEWTLRAAGFPCGSDGMECTQDQCDAEGVCEHRLFQGCIMGGACVGHGVSAPDSICMVCNPGVSTSAYVPVARGAPCTEDADPLTRDMCDGAGSCTHPPMRKCVVDGQMVDEGARHPDSPCLHCNPDLSANGWSPLPAGTACTSDDLSCTADLCDAAGECTHGAAVGCVIDGVCVDARAQSPADACFECNPERTGEGYSRKMQSAACMEDCTSNAECSEGYCLAGVCRPPQVAGTACTAGVECQSGSCEASVCTEAPGPACSCDESASTPAPGMAVLGLAWMALMVRRPRRRS